MGCLWLFLSRSHNYQEDTWVYNFYGEDFTASEIYIASIYWCFTTLTTVGFGDIKAANECNYIYIYQFIKIFNENLCLEI